MVATRSWCRRRSASRASLSPSWAARTSARSSWSSAMAATLLLSAVVLRATGDGGLGDLRRRPAVGLAGVDDPYEDRPALGVTEVEGGGARRDALAGGHGLAPGSADQDRKDTRLNSSH